MRVCQASMRTSFDYTNLIKSVLCLISIHVINMYIEEYRVIIYYFISIAYNLPDEVIITYEIYFIEGD